MINFLVNSNFVDSLNLIRFSANVNSLQKSPVNLFYINKHLYLLRFYLKNLVAVSFVFCCASSAVNAQTVAASIYPNKPIRLIVPFPAGGGNDVVARVIAQKLSERLGQPIVIDNKAGANGIVGIQALISAPPDGYTLAVASAGPIAVNPSLYDKLPYDPLKDLTSITNLVSLPLLLVTHPSVPAKNIKELKEKLVEEIKQQFYDKEEEDNNNRRYSLIDVPISKNVIFGFCTCILYPNIFDNEDAEESIKLPLEVSFI